MLEFDATFLITAISFIIFMAIMNKILYKPITKIIGEREKFYEENRNILKQKEREIEALQDDKKAKIAKTHQEALELLATRGANMKDKKAKAIKSAKEENQTKLAEQNEILSAEKRQALTELEDNLANFVREVAQKVLEKEIDKPDIKGITKQ